jgi:hypothetical protein
VDIAEVKAISSKVLSQPEPKPATKQELQRELHGGAFFFTPEDIEANGYIVVSKAYLSRLEFLGDVVGRFLVGELAFEQFRNEIMER